MHRINSKGPSIYKPLQRGGKVKPLRMSIDRQKIVIESTYLTNHIMKLLKNADIPYTPIQEAQLFNLITDNKGIFKFNFLKKVGIISEKILLKQIHDKIPTIFEGMEGNERQVIEFDSDMEAYLKRKANGEHIFMYFLRMRSRDHHVWYSTYAQVKNHWELARMMDILEHSEHELGFHGFSDMPFHMVIEGKHYDCVPLEVGDLPIEWTLRVEIPECTCETRNWERGGFIGGEWIDR